MSQDRFRPGAAAPANRARQIENKGEKISIMRKNLKSSHDGIVCRVCVADTASKRPALTGETERDN